MKESVSTTERQGGVSKVFFQVQFIITNSSTKSNIIGIVPVTARLSLLLHTDPGRRE